METHWYIQILQLEIDDPAVYCLAELSVEHIVFSPASEWMV